MFGISVIMVGVMVRFIILEIIIIFNKCAVSKYCIYCGIIGENIVGVRRIRDRRIRVRGSRVAGKNELHRRLQVDEHTEEPRLVIFNNCTQLISQLPSLPLDKKNSEDVDTNSMDHMYDALRYGVMTRPRSSIWDYNPVNQRTGFQIADPNFGY